MNTAKEITVVLADDHALFRSGVAAVLAEQPDIRVLAELDNGREAARMAEKLGPDVVLMDISMPGLNGIEATARILKAAPACKVLGLSFHKDGPLVTDLLRSGAAGYISKSCDPDELVNAVRVVARGGGYLGSEASLMLRETLRRPEELVRRQSAEVLSGREKEVLQLVAEGRKTAEIAEILCISTKTVESHRKRIMQKLGLHGVAAMTKYAVRNGITTVDF